MRLLASEGPVVVIGDLRVNGDLHVAEIPHQAVGILLRDLQADLHDGGILRGGLRKLRDELLDKPDVPAGILAGLLQEGRVVPVDPQQLLGELVFAQILDLQLDALFTVQIGEVDRQLLSGAELELPPLAGERVGGVHPHDAAEPVQGLAVIYRAPGRFRDDPGGIAPGLLPLFGAPVEGDIGLRVRQGPAVIGLCGAAGVDGERGGHYQEGAADLLHVRKVAGDVLSAVVVNGVEGDGILALARVRQAAAGFGPHTKDFGKPADQNVRAAHQRLPVKVFARALRDQGNGVVPGPVAVCRVVVGGAVDQTGTGPIDTLMDRGIAHDLIAHKALNILGRKSGDRGLRDPLGILAVFRHRGLLPRVDGERLLPTCVVEIGDLRAALQHADLGDRDNAAFLGGEPFQIHRLQADRFHIGDRLAGDIHDGAANTDDHGGGLDVHGLIRAELFAHVQEEPALGERHRDRAGLLFECHAGFLIQRDDAAVVQPHGGGACLCRLHGLAAVEAGVGHDRAGAARGVLDLHRPFIVEQAHRRGGIALREGGAAEHADQKHEGDQTGEECREKAVFFHNCLLW